MRRLKLAVLKELPAKIIQKIEVIFIILYAYIHLYTQIITNLQNNNLSLECINISPKFIALKLGLNLNA